MRRWGLAARALAFVGAAWASVPGAGVAAPDLVVSFDFQLAPLGASNWQVIADVKLSNDGDSAANTIWVGLFLGLDGMPDPAVDQMLSDTLVASLAAGAEIPLTLAYGPLTPGATSLAIVVDPLGVVAESNEANNLQVVPLFVPEKPKSYVNLRPVDAQIQQEGNLIQYTVWVRNEGTLTAGPFTVDLFVDGPPGVAPAYGYPFANVAGLQPGETKPAQIPAVWVDQGIHDVFVAVDPANAVPEIDEDDNQSGPDPLVVEGISSPQPDVFVSRADVVVNTEGSAIYALDIHNAGGTDAAGPIRLQLFYGQSQAPSMGTLFGDQNYDIVGGIPSGGTEKVVLEWANPPKGIHSSWVIVDPQNAIEESNESNNVFGPFRVDVSDGPEWPDLSVTRFETFMQGGDVRFELDVENKSPHPVDQFDVVIYPDAELLPDVLLTQAEELTVAAGKGLPGGATRTFEVYWPQAPVGNYHAWARLDPLNAVAELNEGNNISGPIAVEIAAPPVSDLQVGGFKATIIDDSIRFTATLFHQGEANSGPLKVAVFYDLAQAPTSANAPSELIEVGVLAPGETQALTSVLSSPAPGTYRAWLVADWLNQVAELDEQNNVAGPVTTTFGNTALLDCAEDQLLASRAVPCRCGGEVIQGGYCCSGAPQIVPCSATLAEPSDDGFSFPDTAEGDVFVPVPSSDGAGADGGEPSGGAGGGGGGDSGCRQTPSSASGLVMLVALVAIVCRRRSCAPRPGPRRSLLH